MLLRLAAVLLLTAPLAAQSSAPAANPAQIVAEAQKLLASKNPDAAIAKFEQVLGTRPQPSVFGIAAAYAMKGDREQCIAWLEKGRSMRLDMSVIDADANLAPVRTDTRVVRLRYTDEDYAQPFVEPVRVLREWRGENVNDQFGWIARMIGDVDGDEIAEFVTSAPTKMIRGNNAGRVYVYSAATGVLVWSADGEPGDQLGIGLEAAGDVNGDGTPDVVAGAPGGGYTRVFSGRDGSVLLTVKAEKQDDVFGRHVSGVGDANGDGHADFIVGAPGNDGGGADAGRAYVYSGADGLVLLTITGDRAGDAFGSAVAGDTHDGTTRLVVGAPSAGEAKTGRAYVFEGVSDKPKFVIDADATGRALAAMFVQVVGDVNADGTPDVFASDFSNAALGPATGRIYVHSGRDGARLLALTGDAAGDGFGTSASVAGDVDGDGHADLAVGAWQHASAAISGGRVSLYSGRTAQKLAVFTGRIPGETFGFDAVDIGDVNGDGVIELLVTSAWSGVRGFHSGRVFVLSSGVRRAGNPASR